MTRTSGLLLHLTCLPGPHGIGDLGPEALEFGRFLARAGQTWWQVLPLTPTDGVSGHSPYSSLSAFAANPLLVSPRRLYEDGLLGRRTLEDLLLPNTDRVDFPTVVRAKTAMFEAAFAQVERGLLDDPDFGRFLRDNGAWLNDVAMFLALRKEFNAVAWTEWPEDLAQRRPEALAQWGAKLARPILYEKFRQYCFFRQWARLRTGLAELGVSVLGDAPIYVTQDSPDVWCNRKLFKLGKEGLPTVVAGVPPDYFSKTGQRWGNPVYDWEANQAQGFDWWTARLAHNFGLFDQVRLDHFRAFAAHWEIPAEARTAKNGRWVEAPGRALLETVRQRTGALPLIAEDLGTITKDVTKLRIGLCLPGMRVLQFGFGDDHGRSPHLPHNFETLSAAYTGTHDNNTTRGWFEQDLDAAGKKRLARVLGHAPGPETVAADLMRLAAFSVARQAIYPVQDLLGLDASARMNVPARTRGNWSWRLTPGGLDSGRADQLADLTDLSGRAPIKEPEPAEREKK